MLKNLNEFLIFLALTVVLLIAFVLVSSIIKAGIVLLFLIALFLLYNKFLNKFQLETNYQLVHAFSKAIDYKDEYTLGHSLRVANYARDITNHMGLSQNFADRVYIAGLLHDVGKIVVSDAILKKPERLTEKEYSQIKKHVQLGVNILKEIDDFKDIAIMIADHHEHWDGSGYPFGIKGINISLGGRILAVADAFDAITSPRVYRSQLSRDEACEELNRCSGTQFDPEIVKVFSNWHCE